MSGWLNGYFSGYYRQSTNVWSGYGNHFGQFDFDDVLFNESVSLLIAPGSTVTSFVCQSSQAFGFSGTGPPCTGRVRAILDSTALVTNSTTAAAALTGLTTNFVDITFPDSLPVSVNLTAVAQEVINDSHWLSGNKITFVVQGVSSGQKLVIPDWFSDSYGVGGGGGGGQSGVNGAFLIAMLVNEEIL